MIGKIIGVLITGGVGTIVAVVGWLIWKNEIVKKSAVPNTP